MCVVPGQFDVFFGQMVWEVWWCKREGKKGGVALIIAYPLFKKFYTPVHIGKWLDLFFRLRRIAPEGSTTSDQTLGLFVVVIDRFLVGVVAYLGR